MKIFNVLVASGALADGVTIDLDESESHHLRVRRVEGLAEVRLFDGAGNSARGTLATHGQSATVSVGIVQRAPPQAATILAVGAGDKDRFLSLAERCTELGVTQLVPLTTGRSQGVDTRFRDSWLEKARRRAREACKQSENPWATTVDEACPLGQLDERHPGIRWMIGDRDGTTCPAVRANDAVGWIIGPEGGFTSDEHLFAVSQLAAMPVSFGAAILRFDTGALAAAAITQDRRRSNQE